jgi:acyl-coenzyme A synthetase/AMP-(fatty) acid ligase
VLPALRQEEKEAFDVAELITYRALEKFVVRATAVGWSGLTAEERKATCSPFGEKRALRALGVRRLGTVSVMLPNTPSFLVATLGVLRAGLVVVNVDPLSSARELEHVLKDAGARAIVVIDQAAATLQQALEQVPLRHVLLAGLGALGWLARRRRTQV